MGVYRRGSTWWYEFSFNGARIRESAHTTSKTIAKQAEMQRRRQLELAANGIARRERPALFPIAAERWLASLSALQPNTLAHYRIYAGQLKERFSNRLVIDINERDIAAMQSELARAGLAARAVNFRVVVLRMILRYAGVWGNLAGRVRMLRERHDVGKAISPEDEVRLLEAIGRSRSQALLPLFVLSIDSGIRASEARALRHRDLKLIWHNGAIEHGWLTVSRSKTEAGVGRTVPLSSRVAAVLTLWLSRFPGAGPDAYIFPGHNIGFVGNSRRSDLYNIDFTRSVGSWKKAWRDALKSAGLHYRWHDCRHTFISRLAENPNVSEQTIMALAGHVSKSMLARYSHIRSSAKQAAIATLERVHEHHSEADSPQKPPQLLASAERQPSVVGEKLLN